MRHFIAELHLFAHTVLGAHLLLAIGCTLMQIQPTMHMHASAACATFLLGVCFWSSVCKTFWILSGGKGGHAPALASPRRLLPRSVASIYPSCRSIVP